MRNRKRVQAGICLTLLTLVGFGCSALCNVLTNGGFEATPFDSGWVNIAGDHGKAVPHGALSAGSACAALLIAAGCDLGQAFEPLGAEWQVEFFVAAPDPVLFGGANRCFNMLLSNATDISSFNWSYAINMRIAAGGAIQFYDSAHGASWKTIGNGHEFVFSNDGDGNGRFNDPSDIVKSHLVRIVGHKWSTPDVNYDVYMAGANETDPALVGRGLTMFQSAVPDGSFDRNEITAVIFRTGYGLVGGQTYVVDDCSVQSRAKRLIMAQSNDATLVFEKGSTSDVIAICLSSEPTATVNITATDRSLPAQVKIKEPSISFDRSNYSIPRTFTISAVDDLLAEKQHEAIIEFASSSTDTGYNGLSQTVRAAIVDDDFIGRYSSYSGIYPHLAVTNGADTECGIGAIVTFADYLWYVTYSAHKPFGSSDKLCQLDSNLNVIIRPESIGGTPANRMIHRESDQLLIASHLIDSAGNVRTVPFSQMPGRMNANARHLTDPAHKVYYITMEEGLYELDVNSLDVTALHLDRNAGGSNLLPGAHGKGGYLAQNRLIMSNNGQDGVLAEFTGKGDPGLEASWTTVDRNKYTDVTGPGGIYGASSQSEPVWAIGWDHKSVLLNVCDNGRWKRFRLPKASFTHDADHGYYTEWPRIRQVGPGPYLMDMHGMFYDFPAAFCHSNTGGIRPVSTFLKMVVDFTMWNDRLVFACNDASPFDNPLLGQNQSNLWFTWRDSLAELGAPAGYGSVWINDAVSADVPSEPYLLAGFTERVLHLAHTEEVSVDFSLEIDGLGNNVWKPYSVIHVPGHAYTWHIFPCDLQGQWIRIRTDRSVASATACFHFGNGPRPAEPAMFSSIARPDSSVPRSQGLIRARKGDDLALQFAGDVIDPNGRVTRTGYYEIGADMNLRAVDDTSTEQWLRINAATTKDFDIDEASVIMTGTDGIGRRLPKSSPVFDTATPSGRPRGIREVVTERSLMNIHGTFYELPRNQSGGLARIRPITTHNRLIYDYCSWRGMLVIAGLKTGMASDSHTVVSDGGNAALWFGNVDDLWKMGPPCGTGGPWKNTAVKAGAPSDPYLMTGFDMKTLKLSHDNPSSVRFTVEVDFLADNSWHRYNTIDVPSNETVTYVFPKGYSAHWVRIISDTDCTATAIFIYGTRRRGQAGMNDFACLSNNWMKHQCAPCEGADLSGDGNVDLRDLHGLALSWLGPGCK